MKITQNGMACCSVVVGRDATWLEHHAAQELRSYIQKISGAVLLVVPEHDAQSVPGGKILIGRPATHGMIRTFEKKGACVAGAERCGERLCRTGGAWRNARDQRLQREVGILQRLPFAADIFRRRLLL